MLRLNEELRKEQREQLKEKNKEIEELKKILFQKEEEISMNNIYQKSVQLKEL